MNHRDRNIVVLVSLAIVLWFALMAARFVLVPFDSTEHYHEEVVLKIGSLEAVDSLNPNIAYNDVSFLFFSLVYDCLTTVDEDMNPTGNLALSWWKVPVDDLGMIASGEPYGSVWEYNLSQNAKWHDGVQFTADDVVYTISLYNGYFDYLYGYSPYMVFIKEAEKVDNYTVRIHFWDRSAGLSMPVPWGDLIPIHILPKHLVEKLPWMGAYILWNWTGIYDNDTSPNMPIVGTGPWMVTPEIWNEWLTGDHITLIRNPNYHWKLDKPGAPEIKIDKILIRFFQESTSMVLALYNAELDVAKFPVDAFDAIVDDVQEGSRRNVTCSSGQSCAQGFVYLSYWMKEGGPNDARLDPSVRKALAMAIDKNWIVDSVFLDLAHPGTTVIPSINTYWHHEPNSTEMIPFNATAAEQLLESHGYIDIDSDGIRECTIASRAVQENWVIEGTKLDFDVPVFKMNNPEGLHIGQYVQNMWKEIGVNCSIYVIEDTIWPTMCPLQMDVSVSWWSGVDPDPQYMLYAQSDYAIGGWSDTGYSNNSYTENFTKSAFTLDKWQRKAYVDECQRILYDQNPYTVLAYPYSNYAWRDDNVFRWGDWQNDPGRSLDAVWGANPLFFDLEPNLPVYVDDHGSNSLSLALNGLIIIAAVGTIALFYFVWKRGPKGAPPS